MHFLISCLRAGEEEETPKILQDKLVRDISKGWGWKGLAGGPWHQGTSVSLQPSSLVANRESCGSPKCYRAQGAAYLWGVPETEAHLLQITERMLKIWS